MREKVSWKNYESETEWGGNARGNWLSVRTGYIFPVHGWNLDDTKMTRTDYLWLKGSSSELWIFQVPAMVSKAPIKIYAHLSITMIPFRNYDCICGKRWLLIKRTKQKWAKRSNFPSGIRNRKSWLFSQVTWRFDPVSRYDRCDRCQVSKRSERQNLNIQIFEIDFQKRWRHSRRLFIFSNQTLILQTKFLFFPSVYRTRTHLIVFVAVTAYRYQHCFSPSSPTFYWTRLQLGSSEQMEK